MSSPQDPDFDPLSQGEKTPAVSFDGAPINATVRMEVEGKVKWLQSRDYDTGKPAFWPPDEKTGVQNPKMAAVVTGMTTVVGQNRPPERRSIWAGKPGNMFSALVEAQTQAQAEVGEERGRIQKGGVLYVRYTGDVPRTDGNTRKAAPKGYAMKYEPGQIQTPDPLATGAPAQQNQWGNQAAPQTQWNPAQPNPAAEQQWNPAPPAQPNPAAEQQWNPAPPAQQNQAAPQTQWNPAPAAQPNPAPPAQPNPAPPAQPNPAPAATSPWETPPVAQQPAAGTSPWDTPAQPPPY